MKISKTFISDFLAYKAGRPLKLKELALELNISKKEYVKFRSLVKEMIDQGQLVKLRRGRIGIPSEMNLVVGTIAIARNGIGSITLESGDPITIPRTETFTALDGDKVMVRIEVDLRDDRFGKVIKVLDRVPQNILGIFHKGDNGNFITPDDRRIRRDILLAGSKTKKAVEGERVVAIITFWDDPYRNPEGEVIERLGFPGNPKTDMMTIIRKYDFPEEFPAQILQQAKQSEKQFTETERKRREDFTKDIIYTIDPADARDHDDAISVEKIKDGYRLGVYIADVSHFVRSDTLLDKEAFERGNSVYLPGRVIPMLPESLSNNLCSLKPDCNRLVYAIVIDYDNKGKMLDFRLAEGVINSRAKLAYEEVQEFFNNGKKTAPIGKVADSLKRARRLAAILQKNRIADGSLDFGLPEAKITLGKNGEIVEIGNRVRLESHRLVEEFMLAANRAVALYMSRLAQKFLYRVHERPNQEKIEAFSYLVSTLGFRFPASPEIKPIQFSRFLKRIKGKPEEDFLNELMLRSMQKAVYQQKNIGHFGLAFSHYAHFTSPIRRYPDLMVHRLLKKLKNGRYPEKLNKNLDTVLKHVGDHCSETERSAERAERDAIKMLQIAYMSDRVGDEYEGVISGMLNFGFFVRLNEIGVEGMIRLSSLDDDYYNFDEKRFRLVGRQTGRIFRLGDRVKVGLLSIDIPKSELNLFLIESGGQKQKTAYNKKRKGGQSGSKRKPRRK